MNKRFFSVYNSEVKKINALIQQSFFLMSQMWISIQVLQEQSNERKIIASIEMCEKLYVNFSTKLTSIVYAIHAMFTYIDASSDTRLQENQVFVGKYTFLRLLLVSLISCYESFLVHHLSYTLRKFFQQNLVHCLDIQY